MSESSAVEIELLAEDWSIIRHALQAAGRNTEDGLGWLLEQGLDRYALDEAEWKAREGQPGDASEPRRHELKRREAQAHLVSMRASTIAAEKIMHELGERVHVLGAEMKAHRTTMTPLREENDTLEARIRAINGEAGGAPPARSERRTFLMRLKALFRGRRDGHQ